MCCLVQYESNVILNLLSQVGRMFPQAVYFPIRTLYLTLKIEQRETLKSAKQATQVFKVSLLFIYRFTLAQMIDKGWFLCQSNIQGSGFLQGPTFFF